MGYGNETINTIEVFREMKAEYRSARPSRFRSRLTGVSPMGSGTNLPGAIITRQEKTVTGSYYGSANTVRDFPLYADLYLKGKLDLDRLISKTYSLEEINEAYADMLGGEMARGLIVF